VSNINQLESEAGLAPTPGYRYAQRIGNQLFVSGQVPNDENGQIVAIGDANKQAQQCLKNLKTLLSVYGFGFEDIQQLVIYVVGERSHLQQAWQAIEQAFDHRVPPATLLGVNNLGYENQWVEIDATIIRVKTG
jgi:enamine deaminase RidA (YjgF/YER057c/UK114 family)